MASTTKANLQSLRTAVIRYKADNDGHAPHTLALLVGGYLPTVPKDGVKKNNAVVLTLTDSGGWIYYRGNLLPNLAGADAYGIKFSDYKSLLITGRA